MDKQERDVSLWRNLMADIIHALKNRARILHKQAANGEKPALDRVRQLTELRGLDDKAIVAKVKRRHFLTHVARECGFDGWSHLSAVIARNDLSGGMGTLMYPRRCHVHWNIWFAHYDEAIRVRKEHGGFLLGYKNQYLIVDEDYIKELGLDLDDPDLALIRRDMVLPKDRGALLRLFATLVEITHAEKPL
jgi:hypothetical protein